MRKIYEKNELTFSLIWIGIYIVSLSAADNLSEAVGILKTVTAPLTVIMAVILAAWIVKNGLSEKYGLSKVKIHLGKYLCFIPLAVIASVNLWSGVALNMPVLDSVLYAVSMLCVGFIEEIIFRGFLFKALCKSNVKRAVIISSVTFGIGHIVNLFKGEDLLLTVLQICYAIALGFLFTIIFYRSGSLLPCIITHSAINLLSTFAGERTNEFLIIISAVLIAVSLLYSVWILMKTKDKRV